MYEAQRGHSSTSIMVSQTTCVGASIHTVRAVTPTRFTLSFAPAASATTMSADQIA